MNCENKLIQHCVLPGVCYLQCLFNVCFGNIMYILSLFTDIVFFGESLPSKFIQNVGVGSYCCIPIDGVEESIIGAAIC